MHKKKAGKFLFIPDNLVVVLFLIALINIASTVDLRKSLPGNGKWHLVSTLSKVDVTRYRQSK